MKKNSQPQSLLQMNSFLEQTQKIEKNSKTFEKLMFIYSVAIKELVTKIEIININDIAGIRVICPLKKDIKSIRNLIVSLPGVKLVKEKDYVTNPKKSGYSSYHLILDVPIALSQKTMYVRVEVQIRTMAMDYWASIEHKLKYKAKEGLSKTESKELVRYAKIINKIDDRMMRLPEVRFSWQLAILKK